jgi:uncharacterized protein involved in exopolysaccharide biosynthesis
MEEERITSNRPLESNSLPNFQDPDEINLYDYYLVVKKRWKLIAFIFFASTIAAAVTSLLMTKIYRAETTLLPIQSGSSGGIASMVAQVADLPFVTSMLPSTSVDKLVNVLESRTVRGNIIEELDLTNVLFPGKWYHRFWKRPEPPTLQDTIKRLGEITNVRKESKGDLLRISVDFHDPEFAARITNQYPMELQRFLSENALSIEKRARSFLGERYQEAKKQLTKAEEVLRDFQTEHKLMAMEEQTEAAVEAIAGLKAQIMAKEVELGVFQKFVTDTHPNAVRIKDQIRGLKKQLAAMESKKGNPEADVFPAFNEAPTLGLEYMRLKRDVLITQKLFELLTQQYELAKIEEAKEDVAFEVIDRAVPPEKRYKPKRKLIVLLSGTVALFMGVLLAFFLEYIENVKLRERIRR